MRQVHALCIRLIANCVLVLAGIEPACAQQPSQAIDRIFSELTAPGSPGCAVGVYRDGKIIFAKGYGLANVEENVPITPQTVFDVGSVSKQFTAASIVLLEKQGKLRLDDDVRKYIPELPDYSGQGGQKITILHLLNHTSGLRDYPSLFLLSGINPDNVTTDDDALGIITRQKGLNFSPGSDWQYSGSGYFLLSLIVKRVSGRTLKDFAEENIFQPLGMVHTQYRNDHTSLIPHRALAYDPNGNGGYQLSVSYGEETGDGMVQTSIEDLQMWDENFYSARVGGKDFPAEMEEQGRLIDGTTVQYAKGLFIADHRGLRTVWHSGGSGGYHAYFLRFPQKHFSVACLCNRGGLNRAKMTHALADLYLEGSLKAKDGLSATILTPEQLQGMAGIYRDPKRGDVWRVNEHDRKLWVEFEGSVLELRAVSPTQFEPVNYSLETYLRFERTEKDGPRKLIVDTGPQRPVAAEAIQGTRPGTTELATDAGDYWSDELRATYRLTVKDGKLWMNSLTGADGIVHRGNIPFDEIRPLLTDEFDLRGAPFVIHFMRDRKRNVTGFTLNGFHERGILFTRLRKTK
jgi:CubicO group peptidase (beta-lactamase class C family)